MTGLTGYVTIRPYPLPPSSLGTSRQTSQPGDTRLPSEIELSQQYGVARMTVRRAVAQLRDKGLVVTVHGRGSFVAPRDDQMQR